MRREGSRLTQRKISSTKHGTMGSVDQAEGTIMAEHLWSEVFTAHPHCPPAVDVILDCLRACSDCSIACIGCADACIAEEQIAELRECIRLNLDCANLAATTGAVIARLTKPHKAPMTALLNTTIAACHACAELCDQHSDRYAHCRSCAGCCRACAHACAALLEAMP